MLVEVISYTNYEVENLILATSKYGIVHLNFYVSLEKFEEQ